MIFQQSMFTFLWWMDSCAIILVSSFMKWKTRGSFLPPELLHNGVETVSEWLSEFYKLCPGRLTELLHGLCVLLNV